MPRGNKKVALQPAGVFTASDAEKIASLERRIKADTLAIQQLREKDRCIFFQGFKFRLDDNKEAVSIFCQDHFSNALDGDRADWCARLNTATPQGAKPGDPCVASLAWDGDMSCPTQDGEIFIKASSWEDACEKAADLLARHYSHD